MWCDGALLNAGDIHVWHLWCDVRNRTFGMSFWSGVDMHKRWGADRHVRTIPHVPRIRNSRNCPRRRKELSSPREHPINDVRWGWLVVVPPIGGPACTQYVCQCRAVVNPHLDGMHTAQVCIA